MPLLDFQLRKTLTQDKTYEAEVVLNYNMDIYEIKSKRIPIRFASLAVKKSDPVNFPNTRLRWNDYYPQLGAKTITIVGKDDQGQPIMSGRIQAEVLFPDNGNPFFNKIHLEPLEGGAFNGEGEAQIRLNATELAPMIINDPLSGLDQIEIRFNYISAQGEIKGSIRETWSVKNNSNTEFGEVLDGLAVFVFDDSNALNHIGKTPSYVTEDRKRYYDFVQELLNQVVTRKRSLGNLYSLLEENGIFTNDFANNNVSALNYLKEHFHIDNTSNPQWDFTKLMRDYNIPDGNNLIWTNRIVDKRTLVGTDFHDADNRINGNGGVDTGLYELYGNVVKRFAAAMIELEEYYAGERGIAGNTAPTLNWYARTGQGPVAHGNGMSYGYGSKNDIGQFNANVANCVSPARSPSAQYNLYYIDQNNVVTRTGNKELVDPNAANTVPANYHANVHETTCNLTGDKKYPGIYAHEQTSWSYGGGGYFRNQNAVNGPLTNPWPPFPQFNPEHWAGTDCSGLAQRGVHNGRSVMQGLVDIAIPVAGNWIRARNFFENNDYVYFLPIPTGNSAAETQARNKILKQVKKSDLLGNGNPVGHITTVYMERATLVGDQVRYKIIHANGSPEYTYPAYDPTRPNLKVFSRKVIISWQNIVSNPVSFGRIKIWN